MEINIDNLKKYRTLYPTEELEKQTSLANIRRLLKSMTIYPEFLDYMTDDELEERLCSLQKEASKVGITINEACECFKQLS